MNPEPLPAPSSSGFTNRAVVRSPLHGGALTRRDRPLLARVSTRLFSATCREAPPEARDRPPTDSWSRPFLPRGPPESTRSTVCVWGGGRGRGAQDLPSLKVPSNLPVSGPSSSLLVRLNSAQGLFLKAWGVGHPANKAVWMGTRGSRDLQPASCSHLGWNPQRFWLTPRVRGFPFS